jgi:hypothetical protein
MPRKSNVSSDVLQIKRPVVPPAPPADLTPAQKAQFVKYINARPADYFDECSVTALAELCRQVSYSNEAARWLDAHPIDGIRTKQDFTEHRLMARRYLLASDRVLRISTRLKLLPSSEYQANTIGSRSGRTGTKPLAGQKRPWDGYGIRTGRDGDGAA